jgi:hypothetical protein
MNTASNAERFEHGRACGIAANLGHDVECPDGGCALLHALGEELPKDPEAVCPVEKLANGDIDLVLWTLDELRQRMQRDPEGWLKVARAERSSGLSDIAARRRRS